MRRSELLLSRKFLIGILFWTTTLICGTESLRGSAVILQAKTKLAEAKAAEANSDDETNNNGSITTTSNVTKPLLTGIPQIDYIHDPNLPRELNGHNLTDYPFYNAIPEEIDFKCDGLHDGFYASVAHKCQVYHHCLFGTRYDFLCANYTAFDQKTFICHFVSEVDCDNSPKYYKRNEALYKEASTTSSTTTTTSAPSTTTVAVSSQPQPLPSGGGGGMRHGSAGGRRRRPYYRRRRPMYEYYYDDEEYADSDYYDEELPSPSHRRSPNRKHNKDNHGESQDFDSDYDASHPDLVKPSVRTPSASTTVYNRPRQAPKIRRPVPKNERDKYDYAVGSKSSTAAPTISEKSTTVQSPASKKHSTQSPADDEYYDEEEEEYEYDEPKNVKSKHQPDYDPPSGYEETRRSASRHRSRMPVRKRTEIYDDYDVKERPRVNRRKEMHNTRYDSDRPRNIRPAMHRVKDYRPGGHKKPVDHRRRPDNAKRPSYDDYYYYDEEEEEEEPMPPKRLHQRPSVEKAKSGKSKPESHERVESKPQPEVKTKHVYSEPAYQRTPKTNNDWEEHETPKENEIPTTEHSNGDIGHGSAVGGGNSGAFRSTQPYKIVKIINNVFKDVDQNIDPVSTEETRAAVVTQPKPALSAINSKAQPFRLEQKRPSSPFDELQNKTTITTTRHFVFTTPVRKPSHFAGGFFATAPETVNKLPERKQPSSPPPLSAAPAPSSPYYKTSSQYMKIPSTVVSAPRTNHNNTSSGYRGASLTGYFVPVVEQQRKVRPVEEQVSENLNAIGYGQSFDGGAAKPQSQQYRQEHRLYNLPSSERLYTNSISFSHQPPSNYDITAPGPSAPAEESATNNGDKKYAELPAYTANADYDVTFNDALQPSTLHPVRRVPSTMFYVQNQQPRRASSSDYGPYADSASFSSLNRSQNRYKRGETSE